MYLIILEQNPGITELEKHIEWMKKNNISLEELLEIFKTSQEYR